MEKRRGDLSSAEKKKRKVPAPNNTRKHYPLENFTAGMRKIKKPREVE